MTTREKTLLSIPATLTSAPDISHIDVLVSFHKGGYHLELQPYDRRTSLHSRILIVGITGHGRHAGGHFLIAPAKRFSAARLANILPTRAQWQQLLAMVSTQGFTLATGDHNALVACADKYSSDAVPS